MGWKLQLDKYQGVCQGVCKVSVKCYHYIVFCGSVFSWHCTTLPKKHQYSYLESKSWHGSGRGLNPWLSDNTSIALRTEEQFLWIWFNFSAEFDMPQTAKLTVWEVSRNCTRFLCKMKIYTIFNNQFPCVLAYISLLKDKNSFLFGICHFCWNSTMTEILFRESPLADIRQLKLSSKVRESTRHSRGLFAVRVSPRMSSKVHE